MEPVRRRPTGARYGIAATPEKGKGVIGRLLERLERPIGKREAVESRAVAVDYRTLESRIREAAARYDVLEVVTEGKANERRILVLDTRNDGLHLELTRDSVRAMTDYGRIVAIRAGIGATEFVPMIVGAIGKINPTFEKLHLNGIISYHDRSGKFLVHAAYERMTREEVLLKLPEPYQSFFILRIATLMKHGANDDIERLIRDAYPPHDVDTTGVHHIPTKPEEHVFSIATVQRTVEKDARRVVRLYVSLYEKPAYGGDTGAQRPEDRVGFTVFFIEQGLKRELITSLMAIGVEKLYLLTANGLKVRTIIDLADYLKRTAPYQLPLSGEPVDLANVIEPGPRESVEIPGKPIVLAEEKVK